MNQEPATRRPFKALFSPRTEAEKEEALEVLPFLLIVTAALAVLYTVSLMQRPELRQGPLLLLFTGLMTFYLALFWIVLLFQGQDESLGWGVVYLAAQTALAFALSVMAQSAAVSFGLFAPLIGVTVGLFRNRKMAGLAVVILLALSILSTAWVEGVDALLGWFLVAVPLTLFVIVYVVLYGRQAEARVEAQRLLKELEVAHEQLTEYALQVEDLTLAAERQRMARELHDTLAQGLAGLILQLEAGKSHLENGRDERALQIVEQALSRARSTLAGARQAIGDLRAGPPSPADLAEAARREVERFSAATGIPCAARIDLSAPLPETTCEHAWRIIAEALSNIARHAQAGQVWLIIHSDPTRLTVEIRDDGAGFDPEAAAAFPGHYGLLGMRERARLAGGTLTLRSAAGAGSTVRLDLPLSSLETTYTT